MSKTQQFITKSQSVHQSKYQYHLVNYINIRTPVDIVCPTHGTFVQRPGDHLHKKAGCPVCSKKHYMNKEMFIQKAKEIHEDRYDYSQITSYNGYDAPHEIVCKEHGIFLQTPRSHIQQKHGCSECGKDKAKERAKSTRLTQEMFLERAIQAHGEKYDYSKAVYVTGQQKVEIVCKTHGSFFQSPENHINKKQGCPICGQLKRKSSVGGYSQYYFDKNPNQKSKPAILYVIEMKCNTDNFIKVGITTKSVYERFNRGQTMHLDKNVLLTKYLPLKQAYDLEQHILKELNEYRYFPNHLKDGKTECLKNNPSVLSLINTLIENYSFSCSSTQTTAL
jgi:DNA-directed RNA polymerase subunit M/transcription elongation factor TFIIS